MASQEQKHPLLEDVDSKDHHPSQSSPFRSFVAKAVAGFTFILFLVASFNYTAKPAVAKSWSPHANPAPSGWEDIVAKATGDEYLIGVGKADITGYFLTIIAMFL